MTKFKVLGHRGAIDASLLAYQNSTNAFKEALEQADGFETDAIQDADGNVYLAHEAKYVDHAIGVEYVLHEHLDAPSATLLGKRRLDELPATEATQLRLKDGTKLPTLPATLALVQQYPNALLNIELKGQDVLGPVLRDISASGIAPNQILLSSFNHPSLLALRQQAPQYQVGALFVSTTTPTTALFPWSPASEGAYMRFDEASLSNPLLQEIAPDYIIIPDTELSVEAAALAAKHFPHAKLIAWVFTEAGGISMNELCALTTRLTADDRLAALIIDKPRAYAADLHRAGQ